VHAAVVIDDGLIAQLRPEGVRAVLMPKIGGAVALDRALAGEPLDFFVLFSSLGSTLGQTGQSIYAAANAWLDAMAHERTRRGARTHAINWAGWNGVGLAATSEGAQRTIRTLEREGIASFTLDGGLAALRLVLQQDAPQVAVIPLDRPLFSRSHWAMADPAHFEDLTAAAPESAADAPPRARVEDRLAAMKPDSRRPWLHGFLQDLLARVLRLPVDRIDVDRPMGALGLESLLALEFRNRLEAELKLQFPATLVWRYPTVRALATHLASRLGVAIDPEAEIEMKTDVAAAPAEWAGVEPQVAALTDEEAIQALTAGSRVSR
jgi:acyl carrier protein